MPCGHRILVGTVEHTGPSEAMTQTQSDRLKDVQRQYAEMEHHTATLQQAQQAAEKAARVAENNYWSLTDVDAGTGCLSSRRPSTCNWMASYIRRSVSSRVSPVATQPGRSGEYAEKFSSAFSKISTMRARPVRGTLDVGTWTEGQ